MTSPHSTPTPWSIISSASCSPSKLDDSALEEGVAIDDLAVADDDRRGEEGSEELADEQLARAARVAGVAQKASDLRLVLEDALDFGTVVEQLEHLLGLREGSGGAQPPFLGVCVDKRV